MTLGRAGSALLAAESRQSVLVVGPTQTRKTSGLAIPAMLEWAGPVIATSIKTDLLRDTMQAAQRAGASSCLTRPAVPACRLRLARKCLPLIIRVGTRRARIRINVSANKNACAIHWATG